MRHHSRIPRVNLVTCERVVYAVLILLLHTFQYGCTCTQPRQPHDTDAHVTQDARCLLQVTDASKTLLSSRMRVRHCCLLLYTDDADMSRPQVVTYHCILYLIRMHVNTTQTAYRCMLCCTQLVTNPPLAPYGCECETRFLAAHRCTCAQHCLCLMSVVGLCILQVHVLHLPLFVCCLLRERSAKSCVWTCVVRAFDSVLRSCI